MSDLKNAIFNLQVEIPEGMELVIVHNNAIVRAWGHEFEIDASHGNDSIVAFLNSISWLEQNRMVGHD